LGLTGYLVAALAHHIGGKGVDSGRFGEAGGHTPSDLLLVLVFFFMQDDATSEKLQLNYSVK
jgi:hypothetical protein